MIPERERAARSAAPPGYFQPIKDRAAKRWDQLEADPELAGPWHQLFKQVQSPRHILSELLQNADDAGASEARVSIENDRFIFQHNGEDFIEAHFASICRFGWPRALTLRGLMSKARIFLCLRGGPDPRPFSYWRRGLLAQVGVSLPGLILSAGRRRYPWWAWASASP